MARKIRSRPPLARVVAISPLPWEKMDAILRLSGEIAAIATHFRADSVHAHDRRSVLALERKVNRRGELLEALREQDESAYLQAVAALQQQEEQ